MKKIILLLAITLVGCSKPDAQIDNQVTPQVIEKVYNNLVYLDGTFEKFNIEGNNIPVNIGDAVLNFEKTTNIKITNATLETNTIAPIAYFTNGNIYSFAPGTQFIIYENSRIIIKKIEYTTSYGKDRRSERYSY